jgi:hypothetical protein
MTNLDHRDAACHSSALKLAALGQRADAISIADLMTNLQGKDETLSEIAKDAAPGKK